MKAKAPLLPCCPPAHLASQPWENSKDAKPCRQKVVKGCRSSPTYRRLNTRGFYKFRLEPETISEAQVICISNGTHFMVLTDYSKTEATIFLKIILILWPGHLVVAWQHEHFDWSVGDGSDHTTILCTMPEM